MNPKDLHRDAIVIDSHQDVPWELRRRTDGICNLERGATPHVDLPRMHEGGISAAFFAAYVPGSFAITGGAAKEAFEMLDLIDRVVAAHPHELVAATTAAEIRAAKRAGKIAVCKGIEGGHAIENSLALLRQFAALGVRYLTLTHTNTNDWCDSCGSMNDPFFDPARYVRHHGLSDFGRHVVREMNRLGVAVDVAHVSDAVIEQALTVSRAPIFASHSSCRALTPVPRNLTDAQIAAIAAAGGVVMVNIGSMFVDADAKAALRARHERLRPQIDAIGAEHGANLVARDAAIEQLMADQPRWKAPWLKVVDHLEHVIGIAPRSVGLGTDFDGIDDPPAGLDDVSLLPQLSSELLARGHSAEVVRGFLGENFLGYLERVEACASALAGEAADGAVYRG